MAGFKRGGFRGGGGGAFKKGYAKKRSGSDEEDNTSRPSKKTKGDEDEDAKPLVPELKTDEEGNEYVALNASGKRRVTISSFKGNTLVSIREYWTNDEGELKPGKKGISMTVDQYNALLAAAPLLESALEKKDEEVIRPKYDADTTAPTAASEQAAVKAEDVEEQGANDDEEEEE